jgi:organic hydroperoxide reductase OsmC/OhrA
LLYQREMIYEAEAVWDGLTGGNVAIGEYNLNFDTPAEYGGRGSAPCPDQLFLSSIGGCILNTFLNFKRRLGAETRSVKVQTTCRIELRNPNGYRLTRVTATIHVTPEEGDEDRNRRCAELARDYCHITKSIEPAVPVDVEIVVDTL